MSRRPDSIARRPINASHASSTATTQQVQRSHPLLIEEKDDCEVQPEHIFSATNLCFYRCFPVGSEYHSDSKALDRLEAKINLSIIMFAPPHKVELLLKQSTWHYDDGVLYDIDKRLSEGLHFEKSCDILLRKIAEHGWIMNLFQVAPWESLPTDASNRPASETQKEEILLSIVAKATTIMEPIVREKPEYERELDRKFRPELEKARQDAERWPKGKKGEERCKNEGSNINGHDTLETGRGPAKTKRIFLPRWEGDWKYKRSAEEDDRLMRRMRFKDKINHGPLPPPPVLPHRTLSMPEKKTAGAIERYAPWQPSINLEETTAYRRSSQVRSTQESQLGREIPEGSQRKARSAISGEITPQISRSSTAPSITKAAQNFQNSIYTRPRLSEAKRKLLGKNLLDRVRTADREFM